MKEIEGLNEFWLYVSQENGVDPYATVCVVLHVLCCNVPKKSCKTIIVTDFKMF